MRDDGYKFNYQEINSILHMFQIFSQDQYKQFIQEKFIQQKLVKEFDKLIHNEKIELDTF